MNIMIPTHLTFDYRKNECKFIADINDEKISFINVKHLSYLQFQSTIRDYIAENEKSTPMGSIISFTTFKVHISLCRTEDIDCRISKRAFQYPGNAFPKKVMFLIETLIPVRSTKDRKSRLSREATRRSWNTRTFWIKSWNGRAMLSSIVKKFGRIGLSSVEISTKRWISLLTTF